MKKYLDTHAFDALGEKLLEDPVFVAELRTALDRYNSLPPDKRGSFFAIDNEGRSFPSENLTNREDEPKLTNRR